MSGNQTERRVINTAAVTGLSIVLAIIIQFLAVPICLKYWGREFYGVWLALLSVSLMLRTIGDGFVIYIGNKINLLYHKDRRALRETLASSLLGVLILAAIQIILVAIVLGSGNLPTLLGAEAAVKLQHADWALVILSFSWVLGGIYVSIIQRLLVPTGMMSQTAWWGLTLSLGLFLAVIVSAYLGFTLLQASIAYASIQLAVFIASAWYIRLKLPEFYPWLDGFRARTGWTDLVHSIPLTASCIVQQGSSNGLVILVSAFMGAAAVPVFATLRTLANLWTNVTTVMTTPLLTDVVRFHANGEEKKLLAVHGAHGVIVGTMVNMSILLAYPFIAQMYGHWTHHLIVLDSVLLNTLLASVSLASLGSLMNTYLTGINHRRAILATTIMRGCVSLLLGGLIMSYSGVKGVGAGIWAGEFLALIFLIHYFINTARKPSETILSWTNFGPALIRTTFVQIYLIAAAVEASFVMKLYPVAIGGVLLATVWDWRRQDPEIKARLSRLVMNRLGLKGRV